MITLHISLQREMKYVVVTDDNYSCDSVLIVEVHWEQLMVEPSRINCFFDGLSEVKRAEENLSHRCDDLGSSTGSRHSHHPPL